ncbi:MAG: HDIG domain-containing protein [Ignavibacteriaceae bacterium]|nr:HDIG domain-containing protein [Ignavibacteriaceae bacterium]
MAEKKKSRIRSSFRVKLLIGLCTIVVIALLFPKGESIESGVSEGSIWIHDDLISPFSFPVLKDPDFYNEQLKTAAESVYPVFILKENGSEAALDSLKSYDNYLISILDSVLDNSAMKDFNPTFLSASSFNLLKGLRKQEREMNSGRSLNIDRFFEIARDKVRNIYQNGIIDKDSSQIQRDSIAVRNGNTDKIQRLSSLHSLNSAKSLIEKDINQLNQPKETLQALVEYSVHFIFPDIYYNKQLTKEEIDQAKSNISRYNGIVNENERIIAKHDRVTKDAKLKIESFRLAKGEEVGVEGKLLQLLGKILHIGSLLTLFTIYLFLFRKKIFYDNQKILLIAINFLFVAFVTFIVNQIPIDEPLQFLIVIPVASMLITIIFDSRVGFYSTVIMVLISGALRGNDYTFAVMNLFACALSVYTVRDIKNRSQIFRSFLFIFIGYVVSILAFGFERFAPVDSMVSEAAFAGTNALISPVLTYGLLIFFERLFKITTDLTLLELSNFDRPLLKELARRAPGTFNHSMTMGTLAETAAETIGANPLLARVGAYYHDIGKTITPQNFVENQLNNQNIHENLAPEESVELLAKHVREGIALAKDHYVPQEIVDFIPMHHGTMVMTYFYEKAKKLYGEEKVNIEEYKYPGPKPNTKETAIVMLADGCESAVRSIKEPDQVKVGNLVEGILQNRVENGQLDDSPITFSDLHKIKESFVNILIGQYHKRIRYPKQDEMEKGIEDNTDEQ